MRKNHNLINGSSTSRLGHNLSDFAFFFFFCVWYHIHFESLLMDKSFKREALKGFQPHFILPAPSSHWKQVQFTNRRKAWHNSVNHSSPRAYAAVEAANLHKSGPAGLSSCLLPPLLEGYPFWVVKQLALHLKVMSSILYIISLTSHLNLAHEDRPL